MELLTFIISTFLFCFFFHGLNLFRKTRKLPPGPIGLPLVGNLLDVGPKPHESLAKLAKKHGPLMTIRLGSMTSVVASSPQMAQEILQKNDEACSGRVVPHAVTALKEHNDAVLWISAQDNWRTIRRALNTYLTHVHKLDTLQDLRYKVVEEMVEFVKEAGQSGDAVDIGTLAFSTALNKISNTCLSQNVTDYKSKDVRGFKRAVKTLMEVDGKFNIADIFPWLKPFDPQNIKRRAKVAYDWFDEVIQGFINDRLHHRQSGFPRFDDMLDSLLDYNQQNESEFSIKHIKVLMVDLFLAATETSSNTTEWAMTELFRHPKVFTKLREEISKIIGENGKIDEARIIGLPYLDAVIKETMRLHLSVPLLVPHKAEKNVVLSGYFIPKNTQILVNAWAIARDPKYWDNPTDFIPERFLESELDYKGQHFTFLPFGSGRRMCPGIPLAQRVVSMMVAALVYNFDWKLPHPLEQLDMNEIFGLTLLRAKPLLAIPKACHI